MICDTTARDCLLFFSSSFVSLVIARMDFWGYENQPSAPGMRDDVLQH